MTRLIFFMGSAFLFVLWFNYVPDDKAWANCVDICQSRYGVKSHPTKIIRGFVNVTCECT